MTAFFETTKEQNALFATIARPGSPSEKFFSTITAPMKLSLTPQFEAGLVGGDDELITNVLMFFQDYLEDYGDLDPAEDPEEDPGFIAEGRRILSLERFAVVSVKEDTTLLERIWDEVASLVVRGEPEKGTVVMAPKWSGGDIRLLLDESVQPGLRYLGLSGDIVVDGFTMTDGAPCPIIRLLFQVDTDAIERDEDADDAKDTEA